MRRIFKSAAISILGLALTAGVLPARSWRDGDDDHRADRDRAVVWHDRDSGRYERDVRDDQDYQANHEDRDRDSRDLNRNSYSDRDRDAYLDHDGRRPQADHFVRGTEYSR